MRLTIFGATGGIGGQLLDQAVAAGHEVTVVVRDPRKLVPSRNGARVVTADLAAPEPGVLEAAVAGADAVLSGVGPRPMAKAGVAEQGTRAIVRAMQVSGVRRILVVSAAPISTVPSPGRPHPPRHDPGEGFFMRNVLPLLPRPSCGSGTRTWRSWKTCSGPATWTGRSSGRRG